MNGKKTCVFAVALCVLLVTHQYATAGFVNVAQGKATSTSSNPFGLPPENAVDGYYAHASYLTISHTDLNNTSGEYWEVDLGTTYNLDMVEVVNRLDCCGDRIDNAVVSVLDGSHSSIFTSSALTGGASTPVYTFDNGGSGFNNARYVRVDHFPGTTNYLSLNEVRALIEAPIPLVGTSANLAFLYGTASQSSTDGGGYYGYDARHAIDDFNGSFTQTSGTTDLTPWFEVDLGGSFLIDEINSTTRSECCTNFSQPEYDFNITIEVLDAADQVVFSSGVLNPWDGSGASATVLGLGYTFNVDLGAGVHGQKVRVSKVGQAGNAYLMIGDLKVMGYVPEPASLVLLVIGVLGWLGNRRPYP